MQKLMLKQLLLGILRGGVGKKIRLVVKTLTTFQLLQHQSTIFSPAGNTAAAIMNTRGLSYGGKDNRTHLLRGRGWFLNNGSTHRWIWHFSAGEQIFSYNSLCLFGWEQMDFK